MAKIPSSELTGSLELIRTTVLVILLDLACCRCTYTTLSPSLGGAGVTAVTLMLSATTKPDYGSKYQIRDTP